MFFENNFSESKNLRRLPDEDTYVDIFCKKIADLFSKTLTDDFYFFLIDHSRVPMFHHLCAEQISPVPGKFHTKSEQLLDSNLIILPPSTSKVRRLF